MCAQQYCHWNFPLALVFCSLILALKYLFNKLFLFPWIFIFKLEKSARILTSPEILVKAQSSTSPIHGIYTVYCWSLFFSHCVLVYRRRFSCFPLKPPLLPQYFFQNNTPLFALVLSPLCSWAQTASSRSIMLYKVNRITPKYSTCLYNKVEYYTDDDLDTHTTRKFSLSASPGVL